VQISFGHPSETVASARTTAGRFSYDMREKAGLRDMVLGRRRCE
jgi:hypothetical protein